MENFDIDVIKYLKDSYTFNRYIKSKIYLRWEVLLKQLRRYVRVGCMVTEVRL